jgi:hypothetical protein
MRYGPEAPEVPIPPVGLRIQVHFREPSIEIVEPFLAL